MTGKAARVPRVVLAEDDAELRRLLAAKLRQGGYDVVEVGTGEGLAQHLIIENAIDETDLIVSDIRMPGLSGLDLLAYLQTRGAFPPVVLITAFGDWRTHEEAGRLGATAVFDKPIDLDDLVQWVRGAVPAGGEGASGTGGRGAGGDLRGGKGTARDGGPAS
jgi:CheY-like chemotaxis protein